MNIVLINNDFRFDIETTAILFFPNCSVTDGKDGREVVITLSDTKAIADFSDNGTQYHSEADINSELYDSVRCACKKVAFNVFSKATNIIPPWGVLTGVRPLSFYNKIKKIHGEHAEKIMREEYLVSDDKIKLCSTVHEMRKNAVAHLTADSFSLYISIPFCPSRCKYCSFVSMSTEKEKKYIQPYVDTLCAEIQSNAEKLHNKNPLTVYIGGGTPTVLETEQLESVLKAVTENFDLSECLEFTVEAGRPETISPEKLHLMKKYGVNRISVNTQTLSPEVLERAGRKHTIEDFFRAFYDAKNAGFDVNVDLIAGLELETVQSFDFGLRKIIELEPANITVHSLYVKRAAEYGKSLHSYDADRSSDATQMLSDAIEILEQSGYFPYYMYRQKNTIGNNENIGFAKREKECLYNIYMMDDIQSVTGCGANAMTKMVKDSEIIRNCSTKFAYNYIKG